MRRRKEALMTTLLRKLQPEVRKFDEQYPVAKQSKYQLSDCVLSVLSVFTFKQSNLFRFEKHWRTRATFCQSVQRLFQLQEIPSDTTIRRRLDQLPSVMFQGLFRCLFRYAQRQKLLEPFRSPIDEHLLLAVDGTGGVSSTTIHCDSCLEKRHRSSVPILDGEEDEAQPLITYSHQTLGAVVVHPNPEQSTVLPFYPEPIGGRDDAGVQDSELKAAHRWLVQFRRDHPKLKVVFLGDALYSNGPMIQALNAHRMKYMIRVKPGRKNVQYAYLAPEGTPWQQGTIEPKKRYRMFHGEPLNQAHPEIQVTVLQECDAKGKVAEWITNREIGEDELELAVLEARRRWQIENATFQTLKDSQGPGFAHNHGHGYQHLANNFAALMLLYLLLEQLCMRVCRWYQKAVAGPSKKGLKSHYWDDQKGVMRFFIVTYWEELYEYLADPPLLELPNR